MNSYRRRICVAIRSSEGWIAALDMSGNWVWLEVTNFDRMKERADCCLEKGRPCAEAINHLDEVMRTESVDWMTCSAPQGVYYLTT